MSIPRLSTPDQELSFNYITRTVPITAMMILPCTILVGLDPQPTAINAFLTDIQQLKSFSCEVTQKVFHHQFKNVNGEIWTNRINYQSSVTSKIFVFFQVKAAWCHRITLCLLAIFLSSLHYIFASTNLHKHVLARTHFQQQKFLLEAATAT